MRFLITTLYYLLASLVGSLAIRIWYNKGPAANNMHIVLVNTAVICCYLILIGYACKDDKLTY